jgi:hypothetical protein
MDGVVDCLHANFNVDLLTLPFIFYQNLFCLFLLLVKMNMVVVAQLVRASDCGSEGRRFEPGQPPAKNPAS